MGGGGVGVKGEDVEVGGDGANPDERIGSDDPVSRDAAVAAAATLSKVPNTSMLLDEIEGSRFSGGGGTGSGGGVGRGSACDESASS
jgi:hypothetical protein